MTNTAAVDQLAREIAVLPHADGPINLLPFAEDTEDSRTMTRRVCEAIVGVLDSGGHIQCAAPADPVVTHSAAVKCSRCGESLLELAVDEQGVATREPQSFIADIAGLNPACPHRAITIDDHRLRMQQAFHDAVAEDDQPVS